MKLNKNAKAKRIRILSGSLDSSLSLLTLSALRLPNLVQNSTALYSMPHLSITVTLRI
jgi:hypothetical protein